jgi:hypothetical protein
MAFLLEADLTDKVAIPFIADVNTDINVYLTKGDEAITSLAQAKGVLDSADIVEPLVYELKEYGLAIAYSKLFADAMAVNNNDAFESDKYASKMMHYKQEAKDNAKVLTYEMITQTVKDITDRSASSFNMWRA